MQDPVRRELRVHGASWGAVHGGYFSSADVARPLIEKVGRAVATSHPDIVLDLGGGTGFLLSELAAHGKAPGVVLANLDCSSAQLATADAAGVFCVRGSVADFTRQAVAPEHRTFLFMMRSVLHYFGRQGLLPALDHLRRQARRHEVFVHQTASFRTGATRTA